MPSVNILFPRPLILRMGYSIQHVSSTARVVEGGLQEMEEEGVLRGQKEIRRKLFPLAIVQLSAFKL